MPREIMKRQGGESSASTQPAKSYADQQQLTEAETTAPGTVEKTAKAADAMS